MLTEADFDSVLMRPPENESVLPDHLKPWTGSPGGAWQFWQRVWRARIGHPFHVGEEA